MIQVLTPTGWSKFDGIQKVYKDSIYIGDNKDNLIQCAKKHKFKVNGEFVSACDIDSPIKIESGVDELYDLINVHKGNEYYTDNRISHNCRFAGSSDTLINGDTLEKLLKHKPIESQDDTNSNTRVYAQPLKTHDYVCLADIGEGLGQDYSTISIIDITTRPFSQAYTYRTNVVTPFGMSQRINDIGRKYNDALAIVESNSIGGETCNALWNDLDYPNMFTSLRDPDKAYGRQMAGLRTTRRTKSRGCTILKSMIELGLLEIIDDLTINELMTFEASNDSFNAITGCNDDMITPLVMFSFATTTQWLNDIMGDNSVVSTMVDQSLNDYSDSYDSVAVIYDDGTNISHNDTYM